MFINRATPKGFENKGDVNNIFCLFQKELFGPRQRIHRWHKNEVKDFSWGRNLSKSRLANMDKKIIFVQCKESNMECFGGINSIVSRLYGIDEAQY